MVITNTCMSNCEGHNFHISKQKVNAVKRATNSNLLQVASICTKEHWRIHVACTCWFSVPSVALPWVERSSDDEDKTKCCNTLFYSFFIFLLFSTIWYTTCVTYTIIWAKTTSSALPQNCLCFVFIAIMCLTISCGVIHTQSVRAPCYGSIWIMPHYRSSSHHPPASTGTSCRHKKINALQNCRGTKL